MAVGSLELSKEKLKKLRVDFRDNQPLDGEYAEQIVNAAAIGYIINRSPSTVRRWGLDEDAPLFPVLKKLYEGDKSPWVCQLGDLWRLRRAVQSYRSGPPTRPREEAMEWDGAV